MIQLGCIVRIDGCFAMTIIELTGRVNESGHLEFEQPANLPPGDVRIIIETINPDAETADDALWDEQFAKSQDVLDFLAKEARDEYYAGLTDDFDPDNDPDAP
jgi:hypothetical protein